MATKKQKREAAEAKREEFLAEVKAQGLAAQKADHDRQREKEERMDAAARRVNQQHRSSLLNSGIDPSSGLLFTDVQMAEMKERANTPERMALYERISAGRKKMMDEPPPEVTNPKSSDPFGFGDMTVGDFRDKLDRLMPLFLAPPGEKAPIRKFLNEE